jgi:23S rRNA pseudouridine1911/1915/1917 synthase
MTEVIPAALDGERVDRVIALLTGLTRAEVAHVVDGGAVRVGGRRVKARSRRVVAGDVLEVDLPEPAVATGLQADASVDVPVVYVDDEVIVVDKPAGLVVHPGAGNQQGTLVHGLLARWPDLAEMGPPERPGIVHRLDKGTSGLLVVARTAAARDALVAQMAARTVDRRYAALAWGSLESDEGLIDAPIQRAEADPTRMAIRAGGREARTMYRVDARYEHPVPATLLECRLETGRTHQIRVHLAAIGHPLVGDPRYGRGSAERSVGVVRLPAGRVWLHAGRLSFDHPATGQRLSFASPIPTDLSDVLARFS